MVEAILLPSLAYSELLATKQTKGEPFDATLARCLKLTLQCEKELDEPEVHQMCIDNRLFDLKYALHTTSFAMLCWQTGELERALAERNADQTARDTRRFGVSSKGCRPKERTAVADTDAPQKQTKKKSDKDKPKESLSSTAPEAQEALLEKLLLSKLYNKPQIKSILFPDLAGKG